MKEAYLYEKLENQKVHCYLCAHQCRIAPGATGICGVRKNENGTLYSLGYGSIIAANIDPIEKKPLYHFFPGSSSFSIAAVGCNFKCGFCQNWEISQAALKDGSEYQGLRKQPQDIVAAALAKGCKSISYTYTEPTIFFEYALDTARLAKERGLLNVFVTNGYMSPQALDMIRPHLDAANVDLKYFRDESYRSICGATLEPVLATIRGMKGAGIWVEVTTLVVPGSNDSPEELDQIARFIAGIDKDMPWHISRFFPNYKFADREPTPEGALKMAERIGHQAGLRYIYVGNVYGWGHDTHCHHCRKSLIKRQGFSVEENNINAGICFFCKASIPGVFA